MPYAINEVNQVPANPGQYPAYYVPNSSEGLPYGGYAGAPNAGGSDPYALAPPHGYYGNNEQMYSIQDNIYGNNNNVNNVNNNIGNAAYFDKNPRVQAENGHLAKK